MRCAATILAAGVLAVCTGIAVAEGVVSAQYTEPTTRYAHGVLGDAIEYGALEMVTDEGRRLRITLPKNRVFEDIAPRVVDLDGDGAGEVIAVETHVDQGARLSVYGATGLLAANDYIGRSNRWLAPVGALDIDGDGDMEIAYVDRPHLAKSLTLYSYEDQELTFFARLQPLTNHRIGQDFISGGVRTCADRPEIIVANADWSRIVAVFWENDTLAVEDIGAHTGPESFEKALTCAS